MTDPIQLKTPLKLKPVTQIKKQIQLKQGSQLSIIKEEDQTQSASSGRLIAPFNLLNSKDPIEWENTYKKVMNMKYQKNTRNFTKKIVGKKWESSDEPPIYLIPRERGGPSYKKNKLEGLNAEDVQYCLISKGFPMQSISSFSLGPIISDEGGLCLVNYAYSKSICLMHIVGGGKVDLKRKDFWLPGVPQRSIKVVLRKADKTLLKTIDVADEEVMIVNGEEWDIKQWLWSHQNLWLDEWLKWRNCVALCGMGDFHWTDNSPVVSYRCHGKYLSFVDWKKKCYITPSIELLGTTSEYQFLEKLFIEQIPIGLVHPKAITGHVEKPVSREYLRELFDSPSDMCCQPMVIVAKLLGLQIYENLHV